MDNSNKSTVQPGIYPFIGYPGYPGYPVMYPHCMMPIGIPGNNDAVSNKKFDVGINNQSNDLDMDTYKEHLVDIQNKIKIISDQVNETIKQIDNSAVNKEINKQTISITNKSIEASVKKKKSDKNSDKPLNFLAAIKNKDFKEVKDVKEDIKEDVEVVKEVVKEDVKEDIKDVKEDKVEKKIKIPRTDEENKKLKEKLEEGSKTYFEHVKSCIDNAIPGLEGQEARYKDISSNITSLVNWHIWQYGAPIKTTEDYTKRNIKPYIDLGVERGFITAQKYALTKGFKLIDISDPEKGSEKGSKKVMIVLCTKDRIMAQESKTLWHGLNKLPIIN